MTETSTQALAKTKTKLPSLKEQIFNFITSAGPTGVAREAIQDGTGIPGNSVSGRITELKADGRIRVVGKKLNSRGNLEDMYAVGAPIHDTPKKPRTVAVPAGSFIMTEARMAEICTALTGQNKGETVITAFTWSLQPEGHGFWNRIHNLQKGRT